MRIVQLRVHRFASLVIATTLVTGCAARAASPDTPIAFESERRVRAHMQFLASDALNGRGSGTRDEWLAAMYVGAHFARVGLEPLGGNSFVHEVRIERAELNAPPTLSAGGHVLTHAKEMLVTSVAAPRISGPLQKFREGAPVVKGAVLLLAATNAPSAAVTAPAAMVLSLESEAQQKRRLAGGGAPFPPLRMQWILGTPRRAAAALEKTVYDAIAALPDDTVVTLTTDVKPVERASTWNAIGQFIGTKPEEVIVLSAHHDHVGSRAGQKTGKDPIYNGADDDASGTTAVLELAETLSRSRTRRTLVFATFGSEETGGQGSSHFIEASGVDLARIVANLQFEMIGRPDPKVPAQTLWLTGYERSDLGEQLARRGARLVADPHPEQSFFTRSDNIRFARRGVIAHTVSSYGLHKDYHQPSDEVSGIDFPHMTRAIQSLLAPIRWLADSDFTPAWKPGMQP